MLLEQLLEELGKEAKEVEVEVGDATSENSMNHMGKHENANLMKIRKRMFRLPFS